MFIWDMNILNIWEGEVTVTFGCVCFPFLSAADCWWTQDTRLDGPLLCRFLYFMMFLLADWFHFSSVRAQWLL